MSTKGSAQPVESRVLWILLSINAAMFVTELGFGLAAESMGLVADAFDMLADVSVYALALLAVGASLAAKVRAAFVAGFLQVILALSIVVEVVRRFLGDSEPDGGVMILVSLVALVANATCVFLLKRHRHGEVHMRAAWLFSASDVQANAGVVLAGILVPLLKSPVPDYVIGVAVGGLVLRSGVRILRDAQATSRAVRLGSAGSP
jgi:cation diffusion facilitator family transporter